MEIENDLYLAFIQLSYMELISITTNNTQPIKVINSYTTELDNVNNGIISPASNFLSDKEKIYDYYIMNKQIVKSKELALREINDEVFKMKYIRTFQGIYQYWSINQLHRWFKESKMMRELISEELNKLHDVAKDIVTDEVLDIFCGQFELREINFHKYNTVAGLIKTFIKTSIKNASTNKESSKAHIKMGSNIINTGEGLMETGSYKEYDTSTVKSNEERKANKLIEDPDFLSYTFSMSDEADNRLFGIIGNNSGKESLDYAYMSKFILDDILENEEIYMLYKAFDLKFEMRSRRESYINNEYFNNKGNTEERKTYFINYANTLYELIYFIYVRNYYNFLNNTGIKDYSLTQFFNLRGFMETYDDLCEIVHELLSARGLNDLSDAEWHSLGDRPDICPKNLLYIIKEFSQGASYKEVNARVANQRSDMAICNATRFLISYCMIQNALHVKKGSVITISPDYFRHSSAIKIRNKVSVKDLIFQPQLSKLIPESKIDSKYPTNRDINDSVGRKSLLNLNKSRYERESSNTLMLLMKNCKSFSVAREEESTREETCLEPRLDKDFNTLDCLVINFFDLLVEKDNALINGALENLKSNVTTNEFLEPSEEKDILIKLKESKPVHFKFHNILKKTKMYLEDLLVKVESPLYFKIYKNINKEFKPKKVNNNPTTSTINYDQVREYAVGLTRIETMPYFLSQDFLLEKKLRIEEDEVDDIIEEQYKLLSTNALNIINFLISKYDLGGIVSNLDPLFMPKDLNQLKEIDTYLKEFDAKSAMTEEQENQLLNYTKELNLKARKINAVVDLDDNLKMKLETVKSIEDEEYHNYMITLDNGRLINWEDKWDLEHEGSHTLLPQDIERR